MQRCPQCGEAASDGPHHCSAENTLGQAQIATALVEREQPLTERDDGKTPLVELMAFEESSEGERSLFEVGAVVGQYRLGELLGEGSIGRVYLAEHMEIGRKVALKMVRSELSKKKSIIDRFFGEARAVNKIHHENIVEITDFVRNDSAGRSYYIMELLEGRTLRAIQEEGTIVGLSRTFALLTQICDALEAVHENGIVHRDLKPENIFVIDKDGEEFVKLLDFGVAKLSNVDDKRLTHTTRAGSLIGTPGYMAPEQTLGMEVDHRTDIYAVGVVLYELVTGRAPFVRDTIGELLLAHRNQEPKRTKAYRDLPHSIPPGLDQLIARCMAKDPADRPQTIAEVRQTLERLGRQRPVPALAMAGVAAAALAVFAIVAIVAIAWTTRATDPIPVVVRSDPAPLEVSPIPIPIPVAPNPMVSLEFRSTPPAAAVFAAGHSESLGTTPLTVEIARSNAPVTYEFRLDGHEIITQTVTPEKNTTVQVVLAKSLELPARRASRKVKRRPKLHKKKAKAVRPKSDGTKPANGIGLGDIRDPYGDP